MEQAEFGVDVSVAGENAGLIICIIDLDRSDLPKFTQINTQPLAGAVGSCQPESARVLIGDVPGRMRWAPGRASAGLAIGEEHPPGKQFVSVLPLAGWEVMREITKTCVGIEQSIRIEASREHRDATLEIE